MTSGISNVSSAPPVHHAKPQPKPKAEEEPKPEPPKAKLSAHKVDIKA